MICFSTQDLNSNLFVERHGQELQISDHGAMSDQPPVPIMRLKELRKKANLSQAKVAEAVDVEQGAVSKWENGHHYPDLPTCFKLAALFGVPFMSLFEDQSIDSELVELVELLFYFVELYFGLFVCLILP